MAATLATEFDAVAEQRADESSRGKVAETTIVDGHRLDGDGNARIREDNDLVAGSVWDGCPFLLELLDDHLHDLLNMPVRLLLRVATGHGSMLPERRAVRMPLVLIALHDHLERVCLHRLHPRAGPMALTLARVADSPAQAD